MSTTYHQHAAICAAFYDLTLDTAEVAHFVAQRANLQPHQRVLFVGSMFDVAKHLLSYNLSLTCLDYSEEMVAIGKEKLPGVPIVQGDLRALPFRGEFDVVLVIGRVFTHLITDEDLHAGLASCKKALRPGGTLFIDNYEDIKIGETAYFNGTVVGEAPYCRIERHSTTTSITQSPKVVSWHAHYTGSFHGETFDFSDEMEHRAWSRGEAFRLLQQHGFGEIRQGDNFDETSFWSMGEMANY